jgi:hypothetical protein
MKKMMIVVVALALAVPVMAQNQGLTKEQMEQMQKALGAIAGLNAAGGAAKPLVDFREMKALLPKELPGGMKGSLKGQKSGAMGMSVAEAEGRYEKDGSDASISIKLTDISGMGAMGAMAHAAWATAEIDNETDDGYEKTTTINGYKGMEKYNTKNKDGELQVFVDNRFVVEVRGNNVKVEQMKAALSAVDLKKLAALQPNAAAPAP